MRIACPGDAVTSIHKQRTEIIFTEVGFDAVGARIPDTSEHWITTREGASIVCRLNLAYCAYRRDVPGTLKREYMNPAKTNSLIQFRIQFEPICITVALRRTRLEAVGRARIFNGRFVIFADTHLH